MIEKLKSGMHKLSVTPEKRKIRREKQKIPTAFKVDKVAFPFDESSTTVWTDTLNFVLVCFLLCFGFAQHVLYTGLGSTASLLDSTVIQEINRKGNSILVFQFVTLAQRR